ncbi:hypothetical protein HPB48_020135 [Haemaphysalis longicornis]|uniref:Plus3 domain-containing protein n=1 Tax=Haemaphysalis longicornis TaxID=44386 RepID=A0A9J6GXL7_HAELO|nr:hypothetical protein HPB48_020135 [Haemaphysalis longicornis]
MPPLTVGHELRAASKLKASDIYSDNDDDDTSDTDDKEANKAGADASERRHSSSSSSSSPGDEEEAKPHIVATMKEVSKIRLVTTITGGVDTAKVYALGRSRTNKDLKLKHGKQEMIFRLEFVSNQDFYDSEFQKWREVTNLEGVVFLTTEEVALKLKEVQDALNYQYNEFDVEAIVREKQRLKRNPRNYAVQKTQLMKQKGIAMLQGNQKEAQRMAGQLEQLETTISAISLINERNRPKNITEIECTILEEAKLYKEKADDPFTRRKCAPRQVAKTQDTDVKPAPFASPQDEA